MLSSPVGLYVLLMLFQCGREARMSRGISARSNEIQILRLCWLHGGFQGCNAWVTDRSGWQSRVFIGVIRRVPVQVRMINRASVPAFKQVGIDDGRVRHERHALRDTV